MRRRLWQLGLACLSAMACGGSPPDADVDGTVDSGPSGRMPGGETAGDTAAVPLEVYLRDGALVAGSDRASVVARLGAPDSSDAVAMANRHDPQVTDSIVTLHYPGARYVFYVVTQADRDLLDLAVIRSNAHLRHTSPGIGTSADSVRLLLGRPIAARADALEYDCRTCEVPLPVTFEIAGGRVRAIRFDYYVD